MKNAMIIFGVSCVSFGTGMLYSSSLPNKMDKKIVPPVQNVEPAPAKEEQLVDGLELVHVTEDGKMIFKHAKVPANAMNVDDFTEQMRTRLRPVSTTH